MMSVQFAMCLFWNYLMNLHYFKIGDDTTLEVYLLKFQTHMSPRLR